MTDPPPFHWLEAAVAGPGTKWLALAVVSALMLTAALTLLARLGHRRPRTALTDQSGVATVEFVLVFPIVMFLAMLLLQSTLAMVGNAMVNYAAFTATRTAIVQIPAPPHNLLTAEKQTAIRDAAVYALLPVSGRLDTSSYPADAVSDGIGQMYTARGAARPRWVQTMIGPRLNYAASDTHTQVTILQARTSGAQVSFTPAADGTVFGPRDAVTVEVQHRLNLAVPYVRPIFADGSQQTADGPGAYTLVTARSTLTNEGIHTDLPPLPTLPRNP